MQAEEQQERESNVPPPFDRKRIALLNGACGQSGRIRIRGQVVDVPVTLSQRSEEWDPFHNLPRSLVASIRPMQDFSMMAVRRPRLQIEIISIDPAVFRPAESSSYPVVFSSEEFNAGDDSFFDYAMTEQLAPGRYTMRIMLRGIDSLRQSVADLAFIGNGDSLILKKNIAIGYGKLWVMPSEYRGPIITSDIDQTFLDTPIHSRQGLIETLFQSPDLKSPIAGLPEVYRTLQGSAEGARPLLFISASPHFFRRTLSAVFEVHSIDYSGLHLKHLQGAFDNMVKKVMETIGNLNEMLTQGWQASWERSLKFLGSSLQSLFDQISYKLATLLENRQMQPSGAREILMGDNTEGDYLIFLLYQLLLRGDLAGDDLEKYLYKLNFQGREALTRDAARMIRRLSEDCLRIHGKVNPVDAVWINLSTDAPDEDAMVNAVSEALPESLRPLLQNGELTLPRACRGGPGFSLAAYDSGWIEAQQALGAMQAMVGKSYGGEELNAHRLQAIAGDFRFQRRSPDERNEFLRQLAAR
ncbi:MAG: hypothetical protein K1X75_09910 [Leptospirales bacterium]|nr:hypothetical protein [Leptospirales bacterium]